MIIRIALAAFLTASPAVAGNYRFLPTTSTVVREDQTTIHVSRGIMFHPDGKVISTCIGRVDYDEGNNVDHTVLSCSNAPFASIAPSQEELQTFPAFATAAFSETLHAAEAFWQFNPKNGFLQFCYKTKKPVGIYFKCEGISPEQHEKNMLIEFPE